MIGIASLSLKFMICPLSINYTKYTFFPQEKQVYRLMKAGKYSGKQGCNKGHRAQV